MVRQDLTTEQYLHGFIRVLRHFQRTRLNHRHLCHDSASDLACLGNHLVDLLFANSRFHNHDHGDEISNNHHLSDDDDFPSGDASLIDGGVPSTDALALFPICGDLSIVADASDNCDWPRDHHGNRAGHIDASSIAYDVETVLCVQSMKRLSLIHI